MLGSLPSFDRLVAELSKLPGIGGKTAARLAFHLLRAPQADSESLADALLEMKQKVAFCSSCFHITEIDPCAICSDPMRDGRLCIVQEPQDLMAIEKSHAFRGRYHVLHGAISPLDGIGPEELKIATLLNRLKNEEVVEILLATNFTVEGEATALYLARLLKPLGVKITRLAHGIPMGSDLEYIDTATVQKAVDSRRDF